MELRERERVYSSSPASSLLSSSLSSSSAGNCACLLYLFSVAPRSSGWGALLRMMVREMDRPKEARLRKKRQRAEEEEAKKTTPRKTRARAREEEDEKKAADIKKKDCTYDEKAPAGVFRLTWPPKKKGACVPDPVDAEMEGKIRTALRDWVDGLDPRLVIVDVPLTGDTHPAKLRQHGQKTVQAKSLVPKGDLICWNTGEAFRNDHMQESNDNKYIQDILDCNNKEFILVPRPGGMGGFHYVNDYRDVITHCKNQGGTVNRALKETDKKLNQHRSGLLNSWVDFYRVDGEIRCFYYATKPIRQDEYCFACYGLDYWVAHCANGSRRRRRRTWFPRRSKKTFL
jgi:hypothetical protein